MGGWDQNGSWGGGLRVWIGFIWLTTGAGGKLMWMRWWILGFWRQGVSLESWSHLLSSGTPGGIRQKAYPLDPLVDLASDLGLTLWLIFAWRWKQNPAYKFMTNNKVQKNNFTLFFSDTATMLFYLRAKSVYKIKFWFSKISATFICRSLAVFLKTLDILTLYLRNSYYSGITFDV
jgi:hypothetical protein